MLNAKSLIRLLSWSKRNALVLTLFAIPLVVTFLLYWRSSVSNEKQTVYLTAHFNSVINQSELTQKQKARVGRLLDETLRLDKRADFVRARNNLEFLLQSVSEEEVALRAIFFNCLGNLYYENDLYDKAVEQLSKSIGLNPEATTYYNLGNVYFKQRRFEEAIQQYERSIEEDQELPLAHYNMGKAFAALKKWDDSISAFHRAEELLPDEHFKKRAQITIELLEEIKSFDPETQQKFNFYFYGSEKEQWTELEKMLQEKGISLRKTQETEKDRKRERLMRQYATAVHLLERGRFEDALEQFDALGSGTSGSKYEFRSQVHWLLLKSSMILAKVRMADLIRKKIIVDNLCDEEYQKYEALGSKYDESALNDLREVIERSSQWEEGILKECPRLDLFSPAYVERDLDSDLANKSDSELIGLLNDREPDELFKEVLPLYSVVAYGETYEMVVDGKLQFGGEFDRAKFMYQLGITADSMSKAFYVIGSRTAEAEKGLRYAMRCYKKALTLEPDEGTRLLTIRNIEMLRSFATSLFPSPEDEQGKRAASENH